MTLAVLLAVEDTPVNPGLLGFAVVAFLGLATWLLIRSMVHHLRKVDLPAEQDDTNHDANHQDLPPGGSASPRG